MLFLLTGDIQTGKTRWLERVCVGLGRVGAAVAGVVAPGVWVPSDGAHADANGFEKLGIDNVLLPGGGRVRLARRRDLAATGRPVEPDGQSEREGLGWAMSDAALESVDSHLAWLAEDDRRGLGGCPCGLFVADELGRLELACGGGLVHAMALLARGPRPGWPHALAVVRRGLLPMAHERLDAAWDGAVKEIAPTAEAAGAIFSLYSRGR